MQERNITVTLEKAKEWYNSGNATLKEIALQAFSEKELNVFDFTKVKSFEDALLYLYPYNSKSYIDVMNTLESIKKTSKASAAMFKLNIVRKVLNTGYDLHLTKNYTWYPYFRFVTKSSIYGLKSDKYKKLGKFTSEGVIYDVLGGDITGAAGGLGYFYSDLDMGAAYIDVGFLSCATEEIAKHFGLYFGMLIMEAMYGDMVDFQIVE